MSMSKIQPALITFTPALGSTTSPYAGMVNITQRLCFSCCADTTPVFQPRFSVKSVAPAGGDLYAVTIHVEGIISYVPCNGGCCCTKQQPLSQDFPVIISSATAPNVTLDPVPGASINALAATPCQPCSRTFVSDTPISLTVA
jgi:hypothetical protein